ncbi:DUF104 domain-containing protein [Kovacikia minuta CCNUW1]|uniref:antitoxin AF2212-like protein n=1 Tax=Kovacikia minuta TaxID=2931930 RepID=UPI001CCB0F8D|nr:antitoxin AF2212-like protein [Kovacikia minuta]UBF26465.1 DUF104 domain-containing protein [Kovacikia minuta CCNUW1]
MTITIEAVYEQGLLRLLQPLPLAEGTRIEIIVISTEVQSEIKTPGKVLAEIAAMPLEGSNNEFSGKDHDSILYPQQGTA